jgi:Flp pilus assembly CpaE family ATPase
VASVDVPALYRAKHAVRALLDAGYHRERLHVVMNRIPRNNEMTKKEIEDMLEIPVEFQLPDETSALAEAYTTGQLLAPAHSLTRRMSDIARKITGVPEEEKKQKNPLRALFG